MIDEEVREQGKEYYVHLLREKDETIQQLNETAHSFKLLNEKQQAEINAKELLIIRKNERIEELIQELKDREAEIQVKTRESAGMQSRLNLLQVEVDDMREQLEKEEEEFSMLHAAIDAKDQALTKKIEELRESNEIEEKLRKELDRHQVIIHRLEKSVEEMNPECADACLSPRSFTENQLINLRDEAITVKTKELWLLSGQNDQLRIQLDELESEIERLQTSYILKENDIARKDRKIEKLESEIESLHVMRKQTEGREKAIEIATTQNSKLLQVLQCEEARNAELKRALEAAEVELRQLQSNHRIFLEKSATTEVEVLQKTREADEKSSALCTLQEKLNKERKELHQELLDSRTKYVAEIDKIQSELVMRRNKQYELTLKLQDAEGKVHETQDQLEMTSEQLLATRCRMEELEHILAESINLKKHLEDELEKRTNHAKAVTDEYDKALKLGQAECTALRMQLEELKEAIIRSMEQMKKNDEKIVQWKELLAGKERLLVEQKERINRLVQEVNRESKGRTEAEMEKVLFKEQLEKIRSQMEISIKEAHDQNRKIEEKAKVLAERYLQLETEYSHEQIGKSKIVYKFADVLLKLPASLTASTLDLKECWLSDHDIVPIFNMLENTSGSLGGARIMRLDLRSNRITQDSAKIILSYFSKKPRELRDVDLRNNYISIEGIRMLASGLESSWVCHVMVKFGGKIECYDEEITYEPVTEEENAINCMRSTTSIPSPVLVIDISSNSDPSKLVAGLKKVVPRKGGKEEGKDPFQASPEMNNTRGKLLGCSYESF
jgi:chromosome segregation ATPase